MTTTTTPPDTPTTDAAPQALAPSDPIVTLKGAWKRRCLALGLGKRSKTYTSHQLEFLMGALAITYATGNKPLSDRISTLCFLCSVGREPFEGVPDAERL